MSEVRQAQERSEPPRRTKIDDISAVGEELSPSELRTISGGTNATATSAGRSIDYDMLAWL